MHTRFKNQSKILREIYMKFLDLLILRLLPLWDFPTSISSASQSLPKLWLLPCRPNKTATLCLSSISPGTEVNHEVPSREKLITCGHRLVSVPFSRVISFPFLPTLDFCPVPSYRYFLHFPWEKLFLEGKIHFLGNMFFLIKMKRYKIHHLNAYMCFQTSGV